MIRKTIDTLRDQRFRSLAPDVLRTGYRQESIDRRNAFWLINLARDPRVSVSQPWMLIGAAHVLHDKGFVERFAVPEEQREVHEGEIAYSVTELGKLSIARSIDLGQPANADVTQAMLEELRAVNAAHTLVNAIN